MKTIFHKIPNSDISDCKKLDQDIVRNQLQWNETRFKSSHLWGKLIGPAPPTMIWSSPLQQVVHACTSVSLTMRLFRIIKSVTSYLQDPDRVLLVSRLLFKTQVFKKWTIMEFMESIYAFWTLSDASTVPTSSNFIQLLHPWAIVLSSGGPASTSASPSAGIIAGPSNCATRTLGYGYGMLWLRCFGFERIWK